MKANNKVWFVLPVLLLFILVACFGYRETYGESDMSIVGMGIVYGANWGDRLAGHLQYGMSFSFGFYQVLYLLMSESAMRDPLQVARAINFVGLGFSLLFSISLSLMLDKLLPQRRTALFILIAFVFCPIALPFLASGHPFIGGCAFLFLGCWFALLSIGQPLPRQAAAILAAGLSILFSLTLRGDVALALPFVLAACWAHTDPQQGPRRWYALGAVAAMLGLAFLGFLYLQRPYASSNGGAGGTLFAFIKQFIALGHMAKGVVLLVLAFGLLSVPLLAYLLYKGKQGRLLKQRLMLAWLVLALPSLAFWLPNPQPARHFLLPILAMYGIIGSLGEGYLRDARRAVMLAFALAAGNQLAAELARPAILRAYQFSYPAEGRRATQQTPLGLFPLDQQANIQATQSSRREALALAASQPRQLIILADTYQYLAAALMAADPTLRASQEKVGDLDALRLSNQERSIYLIMKYVYWPGDALATILTLQDYAGYRIYIQPSTVSRYDRTPVPPERNYPLQ